MDDFDNFLEALGSAGELDSEGGITLNVLKARKKLGSHQLARPQDFLLPFLAVGTLSGATIVDFVGDYQKLRIDLDGDPLQMSDLEQCLGQTKGRGAELALGLRAAGGLDASKLVVASTQGDKVNILGFTDEVPSLRQVPQDGHFLPYVTRIQIQGARVPSSAVSIYDFLRQNASYSPIVAYNGQRLIPTGLVSTPASLKLNAGLAENPSPSMMSWVTVKTEHEHCSGRVWMTAQERSRVVFVRNGVSYPAEVSTLPYRGLNAVLSSSEVKLDISRSGVVLDEVVQELMKGLLEAFERLVLPRVLREYRAMMSGNRETAKPYLRLWMSRIKSGNATFGSPDLASRIEKILC